MDKFTTHEAQIKKSKSNQFKGYRKRGEKTYIKHEVNVPIEKKLKKLSREEKNVSRNYVLFRKWRFQDLKSLTNCLTTAIMW